MSQEKMERYKQAKLNKEEIRKKQKRQKFLTRLGWTLGILVVVGLIAFGIYITYSNKNKQTNDASIESEIVNLLGTDTSALSETSSVDVTLAETVSTEETLTETAETEATATETATTETEVTETEVTETEVAETEASVTESVVEE